MRLATKQIPHVPVTFVPPVPNRVDSYTQRQREDGTVAEPKGSQVPIPTRPFDQVERDDEDWPAVLIVS